MTRSSFLLFATFVACAGASSQTDPVAPEEEVTVRESEPPVETIVETNVDEAPAEGDQPAGVLGTGDMSGLMGAPSETDAEAETEDPDVQHECTRGSCPEGQMCTGPEGCGFAWTCQPARPCTRDLVPFCACDGRTFRGSSRCPDRPYRHRGACRG